MVSSVIAEERLLDARKLETLRRTDLAIFSATTKKFRGDDGSEQWARLSAFLMACLEL